VVEGHALFFLFGPVADDVEGVVVADAEEEFVVYYFVDPFAVCTKRDG
jgi:hypothetical protein